MYLTNHGERIMSTSLLYHTQKISNFKHVKYDYDKDILKWTIERAPDKFRCPHCQAKNVTATRVSTRKIRGLPCGCYKVVFYVTMHRIKCHECGSFCMEELEFIPKQKCHYTKKLAKNVIRLRQEMTISAVADYMGLHWNTVKDIDELFERLCQWQCKLDKNNWQLTGVYIELPETTHVYMRAGQSIAAMRKIAVNVGQNRQKALEIVRFCRRLFGEEKVFTCPPRRGAVKVNKKYFEMVSGWKCSSSEHSRDAAMLILGRG